MDADPFDEAELFRSLATSGARFVLVGRRALIALGLPVLTSDYDLWAAADDAERINAAVRHLELIPNRPPDEARRFERYVLENGERVDVLVARQVSTVDGEPVRFDDVFSRRTVVRLSGADVPIPSIDDLILTKRFGARPRDADDIRLLRQLKEKLS